MDISPINNEEDILKESKNTDSTMTSVWHAPDQSVERVNRSENVFTIKPQEINEDAASLRYIKLFSIALIVVASLWFIRNAVVAGQVLAISLSQVQVPGVNVAEVIYHMLLGQLDTIAAFSFIIIGGGLLFRKKWAHTSFIVVGVVWLAVYVWFFVTSLQSWALLYFMYSLIYAPWTLALPLLLCHGIYRLRKTEVKSLFA